MNEHLSKIRNFSIIAHIVNHSQVSRHKKAQFL